MKQAPASPHGQLPVGDSTKWCEQRLPHDFDKKTAKSDIFDVLNHKLFQTIQQKS
jgi:hypothetical protein